MKILKTGKRFGSKGIHAVVQSGAQLVLMVKIGTNWMQVLKAPICPETKRHFLNQIF